MITHLEKEILTKLVLTNNVLGKQSGFSLKRQRQKYLHGWFV